MSPRSLLFCSNRETSQLLSRFLRDLRFEVEHCPEIFEAVRRLTAHPHELVVIDWDEGLEASFLLKTVRELKSNRSAFVIALARPEAVVAVRQAGANEVVTKAQVSEEIQNSWVSSRDFLAGLERRFAPPVKPAPAMRPAPVLPTRVIQPPPPPIQTEEIVTLPLAESPVETPTLVHVAKAIAPANLTFGSLDRGLFSDAGLLKRISSSLDAVVFLPGLFQRRNVFLARVAMVIAFFAIGYIASQSQAGASIIEIYQEAVGIGIRPVAHRAVRAEARPLPGIAQASMLESGLPAASSVIADAGTKVEVTPLHYESSTRDAALRSAPQLVDTSAASDSPAFPDPPRQANQLPESLTSQFPGGATIRNVAEKISPAILGALEPVNLPGYLAEKLLVDKVEPSYPAQALRSGMQGPVVLQAWIGKDGKIRNLKLVRGPLLLGQAAYQAVKQWRYQPYLMNGEAVEAETYVTVDFKLP
jgi:TonB family protein